MSLWVALLHADTKAGCWCSHVNTSFPEVRVNVETFLPRSRDERVETVRIEGEGHKRAVAALEDHPGVQRSEVLEQRGRASRLRITSCGPCPLMDLLEVTDLTPEMPFQVNDGCGDWLLIGPPDRLRACISDLEDRGLAFELVRLGPYETEEELTPRQQEVLQVAISQGYYAYPRQVTLTSLADQLGIAKSTLSEALMVVESKIIPPLLTEPT